MDLRLMRVFQSHVLSQCEFMLLAANEVNAGLQSHDNTRVFGGLQSLLNAAANISKALWGVQGGKFAAQRQPLRDSISVTDASPLRTVTMRNNFEHFDERLDKWWKKSKGYNFIDSAIGPKSALIFPNSDPLDWFRWFDPQTAELYFWGEVFNVQELINEVRRILPKLREEESKPHSQTNP
jgi:hypothetical protein